MDNAHFDIGQRLSQGWTALVGQAGPLILGGIIAAVVASFSAGLLAGPMLVGYHRMVLKAIRGQAAELGELTKAFDVFVPGLILTILLGVAVVVGSALLVLPGLAAAWLFAWSFWFMADGELSPTACMKRSMELNLANPGATLLFLIVVAVIGSAGTLVAIGSLLTLPLATAMAGAAFDSATA